MPTEKSVLIFMRRSREPVPNATRESVVRFPPPWCAIVLTARCEPGAPRWPTTLRVEMTAVRPCVPGLSAISSTMGWCVASYHTIAATTTFLLSLSTAITPSSHTPFNQTGPELRRHRVNISSRPWAARVCRQPSKPLIAGQPDGLDTSRVS